MTRRLLTPCAPKESFRRGCNPASLNLEGEVAPMTPSLRTIIDLNIKHYRELLKTEMDTPKRRAVVQLLAEEEAKSVGLASAEYRAK